MNLPYFVDLCSSDEPEEKKEKNANFKEHTSAEKEKASDKNADGCYRVGQGCVENRCRNIINGVIDLSHSMDQRILPANSFHTPFSDLSMPICRQFWKAGDYEARPALETSFRSCQNRMRVHPKFLHSNATSHKWAFGAIAELLDNAIDEVQNGATFVTLDKITNLRDGNPAILVQDDGGGMDPESLRCCMSFGFSDKQSDSSIGQYGNGFKTSTMRLGADVIVFSRCMSNRTLTQSVGLLSYTFLRLTSSDDVVVPMVDYEFNQLTGGFEQLLRNGQKQFSSNLATLLKWSPFHRESELLKQFSDIGLHGTKVIVFNLWDNDDGNPELDFDSDPEDIMVTGASQIVQLNDVKRTPKAQMHVASRLLYSLRAYSSILYLHMPQNFSIILRGQVVKHHQIANDLKYCECIKYKPQCEEKTEAVIVTTIGFLKDAPKVDIHGFSVYHRNRLILPFWRVVGNTHNKGKGVAGILEANFIKPTHDKQDFEKSTLYQKLELRLRDMTFEYWDYHCHLVGYKSTKLRRAPQEPTAESGMYNGFEQIVLNNDVSGPPASMDPGGRFCHHISAGSRIVTVLSAPPYSTLERSTSCNGVSQAGLLQKRRHENLSETASLKRQAMENGTAAGLGRITSAQLLRGHGHRQSREIVTMVQFNKKLRAECKELERAESQLLVKVQKLRSELLEVQRLYEILSSQLKLMDEAKVENCWW